MIRDRRTAARDDLTAHTRADARQDIVEAWKRAGWPRAPHSGADYERLRQRMLAYVAVVFPQVDRRCRGEVVGRTLDVFMARLHARRPGHRWPEPEALVDALEDVVLNRAEEMLTPAWDEDDPRVASLAFRSTPARVRAGLTALAAEGRAVDYRAVTLYLDLVDLDRTRPPSLVDVVAGLRSVAVTEQMVRQVLTEFRRRVQVVDPHDDT
jgi:hypothetical protein